MKGDLPVHSEFSVGSGPVSYAVVEDNLRAHSEIVDIPSCEGFVSSGIAGPVSDAAVGGGWPVHSETVDVPHEHSVGSGFAVPVSEAAAEDDLPSNFQVAASCEPLVGFDFDGPVSDTALA